MDTAVKKIIEGIQTWQDLAQFEANARQRQRFDDEVRDAVRRRSFVLARGLIAQKTGLDLTDLTAAETKIVEAVSQYVALKKQQGVGAEYTFRQIQREGLIGAAESAVSRSAPTKGFQTLAEENLSEISYERIVVDHPQEFSPRALWYSRQTLGLPNEVKSAPAKGQDVTQVRTNILIQWLKTSALENAGRIPVYSNLESAVAVGMDDLKKFGRVMGNIQSRIDFACFVVGLPPLGLTAEAPFEAAWATEGREWAYPVSLMQRAAQERAWSEQDFDAVLRETERLPGLAHTLWKDALVERQEDVQRWAFGLTAGAEVVEADEETQPKQRRNPVWSRDELILALDLYMQHRSAPLGKESPEIVELSDVLKSLGEALGQRESATYRNANGVYMKLMNFRRFDPDFAAEGKSGLARGNKDEERVWNQFADDVPTLRRVALLIREGVADGASAGDLVASDEPWLEEAEEGQVLTRVHRTRERDRRLVEAAKALALRTHGRLHCAACGFDFKKSYGSAGEGIIDVHHTKPVHTLQPGEKTKVTDLVLLCSNCHRVVHSRRTWLTVEEVVRAIQRCEANP